MNTYHTFKTLHHQPSPLLLANVWDANSAQLAQKAGFSALGTSSHAIANALGYKDGEEISFEALLFIIKHIAKVATVPLSVDFEAGYSDDPAQVATYVKQLTGLGIVGINIEDGIVKDGKRMLGDMHLLAQKIEAIKAATSIFINARTDTYTTKHPHSLDESITRSLIYQAAGADGIFVPLMEKETDIKTFIEKVGLPLNVFITPGLADYETLGKWGVKRISHGAKQYELLMKKSEVIYQNFLQTKNYQLVLGA
jgi:2-methylisocitrate lyase-like PEP mutase family enzyme